MDTDYASPSLAVADTPTAQRPRRDLYAGIHKGLRAYLGETLVRIGRIDVDDRVDRDAGLAELDEMLAFCGSHLRHENEFVHTAIEARRPAGSSRIAEEHVGHLESMEALRGDAAALRNATPAEAPRLLGRLYRHLALFVADNFQHMHLEETAHNALLWEHYSDVELEALHGRLLASLTPQAKLTAVRWIVPASTPMERAAMIAGMRTEMPPEPLLNLMAMLRAHLDRSGWAKLARAAGVTVDFAA